MATPPISSDALAKARQAGGIVRASLASNPVATTAALPDLGTQNPAGFDHTETRKPRTAGHVLAEILGHEIAYKRAEQLFRTPHLSEADKALRDQVYSEYSEFEARHKTLWSEFAARLETEHSLNPKAAQELSTGIQARLDPSMLTHESSLKDLYEALVKGSTTPDQTKWFMDKDKGAPDVDHYEAELKKRTENLARIRELMDKAKGGDGTFSGLLSGLAPALEGPPAKVMVNETRRAVTAHMKKHGYSDDAAYATAVIAERAAQTNWIASGANAILKGSSIVIPPLVISAWKNGSTIDVTSGEWKTFQESAKAAGINFGADASEIMKLAYTEISASQRNLNCTQAWNDIVRLKPGNSILRINERLTAAQKEGMPPGLPERLGKSIDEITIGDLAGIATAEGAYKEATALTGSYAQADAQKGLRPFSRTDIKNTLRGAQGMPPDGSTITSDMEKYIEGGREQFVEYTKGQGHPPMKMGLLGNPKPVDTRDYAAERLPSARRLAENEPLWKGGKGLGHFTG